MRPVRAIGPGPFSSLPHRGGVLAVLACAGLAAPALGQNRSWLPSSGQWSVPTNWTPVGAPTPATITFVGNTAGAENGAATMDTSVQVAALVVTDGMTVHNNHRSLRVNGNTAVTGANTVLIAGVPLLYPSRLLLDNVDGLSFLTHDLLLADGGRVHGDGSPYANIGGKLTIDSESRITGNATFYLDGEGTSLVNDGVIRPAAGDGLKFYQGMVVSDFDVDGTTGNGRLLLDTQGSSLQFVGSELSDAFSGTVTMRSDTWLGMHITQGWEADPGSEIQVTGAGSGLPPALISGGTVTLSGDVNVAGTRGLLRVLPNAVIQPTASVNVGFQGRIEFTDNPIPRSVTINGGDFVLAEDASVSIAGQGRLRGGSFVVGQFAHVTFGGPTEITGGAVQSDFPGAGIHFYGPTEWNGTLTVTGASPQSGLAALAGAPAHVVGPTVINARTFDMDGGAPFSDWTVDSTLVINADTVDGGPGNNGVVEGDIQIAGGLIPRMTVNVTDPQGWIMGGRVTLTGDPGIFLTKLAGSEITLRGGLELTGGRAQVMADAAFESGSVVDITAASAILRMRGQTSVAAAAEFPGAGTLQNGPGGVMILADGAAVDQTGLVNEGQLRIGSPHGAASVDRLRCTPEGSIRFSIDGDAPGAEHDLLIVSGGAAELDGAIEIDHSGLGGGGFVPQPGQEFTVLTALGGIIGTFDNDPVSMGAGGTYEWTVVYNPNTVVLRLDRVTPGPCYANCDGSTTPPVLNVSDFICFQTKFAGGSPYANCDGSTTPPILNVSDFICFQSKFAAGCP